MCDFRFGSLEGQLDNKIVKRAEFPYLCRNELHLRSGLGGLQHYRRSINVVVVVFRNLELNPVVRIRVHIRVTVAVNGERWVHPRPWRVVRIVYSRCVPPPLFPFKVGKFGTDFCSVRLANFCESITGRVYLPGLDNRKNAGYGVASWGEGSTMEGVWELLFGMSKLGTLAEGVIMGVFAAGVL
jgi:hypothetical protein